MKVTFLRNDSEADAQTIRALSESGNAALFVDVRRPDEYAQEHIEGNTLNLPVETIDSEASKASLAQRTTSNIQSIIYHCQSGRRTTNNETRILATIEATSFQGTVYCLANGFAHWQQLGLPTTAALTNAPMANTPATSSLAQMPQGGMSQLGILPEPQKAMKPQD